MTGNKSLLAIGAGVIALVVVTLAVVLLTDDGESGVVRVGRAGGRVAELPDRP
jgi:hypothetical protein